MANPIDSMSKGITQGWSDLAKQAEKTVNDVGQGVAKSLDEYTSSMGEELNDVGEAAKSGNLIGAAFELGELFSPGTHGAHALAALGGPKDPVAKELISGAVNFIAGNPVGAAKDMADMFAALGNQPGAQTQEPAASQTCMRPRAAARARARARIEARASAKADAKAEFKEAAKLKAENRGLRSALKKLEEKVGGGYAPSTPTGGSVAEQLQSVMKEIESIIGQLQGNPGAAEGRFTEGADWLKEVGGGDPDSEVAKLPPNATFEDLVAAFMMDCARDQQRQVKDLMQQMQDLNNEKRLYKFMNKLESAGKQGISAVASTMGPVGGLVGAAMELQSGGAADRLEQLEESRQMLFEKLKQAMQKLQEMMQSLSNVLNTMHEGAMNSIRNIK